MPLNPSHYIEVIAILDSDEQKRMKVERILCIMCGFTLIAGRRQDAGDDKPFDGASPNGRIQADFKHQRRNVLDIKKEKPGKQFTAWINAGRWFIPIQIVFDELSLGWYIVPGIPWGTSRVVLDPLVVALNPLIPLTPFMFARCSLDELRDPERFHEVQTQLQAALEEIEENGDLINAAVGEEYSRYITSTAENTIEDANLMFAVYTEVGKSPVAIASLASHEQIMDGIAKSTTAMNKIAQSSDAMNIIAQSTVAMNVIAQSTEAMNVIAQSTVAMNTLAHSKEAIQNLVQTDEAIDNIAETLKNDPVKRARLLALLGQTKPEESAS